MTDDVLTGKHVPARTDIPRAGTTSGTDTLLPGPCATATCYHKEHQLTKVRVEDESTLRYGWCAPSHYMTNMFNGRTHVGTLTSCRRWWQIWKPKCVSWQDDIPCYEEECELEHSFSGPLAQTLLELPAIYIRRGGIRFPTNEEST